MLFSPPSLLRSFVINFRSRHAFTLIELVIVILILSIFFGIGYSSLIRARTNANFKQAVNETVGIIQNARNKALTNPEIVSSADGTVYVATAFYVTIYTTTNTLSLYADIGTGIGELLESVILEGDITLTVTPSDLEQISYEPPMGELTFVFTSSETDDVVINLSMAGGAFTQDITIDQFRGMPEKLY